MSNPIILAAGIAEPTRLRGDRRYEKDVIRDGKWHHKNGVFNVTPELRAAMAETFQQMRRDGVPVEAVLDHKETAATTVGKVVDLINDGDTMYAQMGLDEAGETAAKACQQVSLLYVPEFKAGNGKTYKHAVRHISIGPKCRVTGQGEFVQLSEAAGGGETPIYIEQPDYEAQLSAAQAELATAKAEIVALKGQVVQLSGAEPSAAPNASLVTMAATTLDAQIKALANAGNITPAVAAELSAALLGTPEDRSAISLALTQEADVEKILATKVIGILAKNKPVDLKPRTGAQVQLSNPHQDEPDTSGGTRAEMLGALPEKHRPKK